MPISTAFTFCSRQENDRSVSGLGPFGTLDHIINSFNLYRLFPNIYLISYSIHSEKFFNQF